MLFAIMTSTDWILIIGAIVVGLSKLYDMRIESEKAKKLADNEEAKRLRDEEVARLAALSVKTSAAGTKAIVGMVASTNDKVDDVARTAEHGVVLSNSAMLAEKLGRAESDERLAVVTGKPEDIARAEASRKSYETHKKEQAKLTEEIKKAAEKRAEAKLRADKIGTEAALVNVQENIEQIQENTGKLVVAATEVKTSNVQ